MFSAYLLSVAIFQSLSNIYATGLWALFCGPGSRSLSHRFFITSVKDRRLGVIPCLKGDWMSGADRAVCHLVFCRPWYKLYHQPGGPKCLETIFSLYYIGVLSGCSCVCCWHTQQTSSECLECLSIDQTHHL